MTPQERRERARLRSERWRRAHGIGQEARATAVALGRHQPKHMVSAAQASPRAGSVSGYGSPTASRA
jgi:hypothetical protein